jgi:hypothetical protein
MAGQTLECQISAGIDYSADDVGSSPPTTRHASDAPAAGSEAPSPQPQNPPLSASRGREGMEGSGGVQPRRVKRTTKQISRPPPLATSNNKKNRCRPFMQVIPVGLHWLVASTSSQLAP